MQRPMILAAEMAGTYKMLPFNITNWLASWFVDFYLFVDEQNLLQLLTFNYHLNYVHLFNDRLCQVRTSLLKVLMVTIFM